MDSPDEIVAADAGGQGGQEQYQLPPSLNPGGQTSDTRLLKRAISQRWPITDEIRRAVVVQLTKVVVNKNGDISPREVVSAAKGLIAADKINLEAEQGPAAQNHLHIHGDGQQVREFMNVIEQRPDYQRFARDLVMGDDASRIRSILQSGQLEIGRTPEAD